MPIVHDPNSGRFMASGGGGGKSLGAAKKPLISGAELTSIARKNTLISRAGREAAVKSINPITGKRDPVLAGIAARSARQRKAAQMGIGIPWHLA